MHCNIVPKTMFLGLVLSFIFLTFSASTSSCEVTPMTTGNDYKTMAWNDAIAAGIPAQLFVNQIDQESKFNPSALSSEGAQGIAQFMPDTARGLGINPWNAEDSLRGAAQLMARYASIYGDYKHALAAYNCGTGCLNRAEQNCSYFYWCLPEETEVYINRIMG